MNWVEKVVEPIKTIQYKPMLKKALRVGLFAFVASFIVSVVLSLILNILFLENVNEVLLGAIGTSDKVTLNGVIKMTSFIMNISVFNQVADLKFGFLVFAIVPMLSFYFADRQDNKSDGFSATHILVYFSGSVIYSVLVMAEAFLSKGELLGVVIDFFSFRNFAGTVVLAFFIQLAIGFNYDAHGMSGITPLPAGSWRSTS